MATNKELYAEWCRTQQDIPVFLQAWWLTGVCAGKEWDVLFSKDEAGEIRAALPYLIRKRLGMRYIIMPQETQIGGMWVRKDLQDDTETIAAICRDFVEQLREMKLWYYYQQYPIGSPCPAQMKQSGFAVKERQTYRINELTDLDSVINRFSKNKKRQLQKALSLHADFEMSDEEFYHFHEECLRAQGKEINYTREFFLVIYRKAVKEQAGQIIRIQNADGVTVAAVFVVWDEKTLYYLIPCYHPQYKDSGASALLVLEAIKFARGKAACFDFEGSMIPGVANHYKQFGSVKTKYYSVRKYYHPIFAVALLVNWFRNRKFV